MGTNANTSSGWPPTLPTVDTHSSPSTGFPPSPQPTQANGLAVVNNTGIAVSNGSSANAVATAALKVDADGRPSGYQTEPVNLRYTWLSGTLSGNAVLKKSGTPIMSGSTFTQKDIDDSLMTFDADAGAQSDDIVFRVHDLRYEGVLDVTVTFASS